MTPAEIAKRLSAPLNVEQLRLMQEMVRTAFLRQQDVRFHGGNDGKAFKLYCRAYDAFLASLSARKWPKPKEPHAA